MFQIDRSISLENTEKITNFQHSVRGGYYIAVSYDIVRGVFVLFTLA